jgi:flagellar protein FlaG
VHGTSAEGKHENTPEQKLSYIQAMEMTERIQGHLDRMSISLRFSTYGKDNEKISVTVYEKDTGKVIREIPPEEFQRLNEKMEEVIGLIFNGNA